MWLFFGMAAVLFAFLKWRGAGERQELYRWGEFVFYGSYPLRFLLRRRRQSAPRRLERADGYHAYVESRSLDLRSRLYFFKRFRFVEGEIS